MRIPSLKLAGAVLLTGATAFAGSFSSNFSDPNNTTGFTLQGSGTLSDGSAWFPFITNNEVRLTVAQNSLGGTLNLDDLDAGASVQAFTATFKLQFGPGSGNPADGMSFIFGPDVNSGTMFDEEGNSTLGAADSSLIVEFDTYDNGGGEAPAVDVKFGGQEIAHHSFAKSDMLTGKLEDVFIQLNRNNTLNVSYKGQVVYTNLYLNGWTATNGQFGFNARTGGENEETDLAALSVTTTPATAPVAPTITSNPQSVTISEGGSTNFSFGFDGSGPFTFQWNTNGVAIAGATNSTLSLGPIWFAANGEQVTVSVTNSAGGITSGPATITVNQDLTPLTLVTTAGSEDFTHATVTFSKPVQLASAQTVANYTIPGLTILSATVNPAAQSNVVLVTSAQTPGSNYVLTVSNVKDQTTAGNTVAANSTIPFVAYAIAHGICKAEYFNNINGTAVSALTSDPRFTNDTPDLVAYHVGLDASESYVAGFDVENYGGKVTGWIVPTVSGNYNFFLRSDDSSQLFLSTDATAANLSATPIAEETGCCHAFQEPGAATTTATPIALTGGQRYYFVALLKEGGGGDYVQVAMRQDTDTTPAANLKPISGANLEAAVSPVGATLTINQQPANQTAEANEPVTFTIGATGSSVIGSTVLYQWQRNGQPIAGATGSSYTLASPTIANDNNAQFNVVVEVPGKILTSSSATLTVMPDTTSLQASVSTITTYDGKVQVGVTFDEPADLTTLVPANFTLTGGTVTNFKLATNSFQTYGSVVLTATGLTPGNNYSLQIQGVKDPQGNASSTNVSFTVSPYAWAETGTQITPGQVVPVGTNGFDVLNGGREEWGTYDEIDMAYLIKTNDFDVRVEVVYAEPASEWTRVGLQARNDMNVGEPASDRLTGANSTASAYAQTHVNPSQTLGSSGAWDPNAPGHNGVSPVNTTPNNGHEQNQRLTKGGATSGWGSPSTPPPYPNAWLRLQRTGTTLHGYRSSDGVNWVDQGTTTLTDQQNYMYVGPFLGVETGNIWTGTAATGGFDVWNDPFDPNFDRLFVAQFRNFGDVPALAVNPTIAISKSGSTITINYSGTLQSSPSLGPTAVWTAVANATSPYTVSTSGGASMFFRAAP